MAPGKQKKAQQPDIPPPAQKPSEIVSQAAKVSQSAGRRLRKKTGRGASRLSSPALAYVPAPIARAGLSTSLG